MDGNILSVEKSDSCYLTVVMADGTAIDYKLTAKDNGLLVETMSSKQLKNHISTKVSYLEHPDMKK